MGASRENFSLKWVYSEKLFFKMGVSRENFFFNMGVSRENFSSKWVYQVPFLYRIKKNYSFIVSCHVTKAFLLM